MVTDKATLLFFNKYEVVCGLALANLDFTMAYSKGLLGGWNGVSSKKLCLLVQISVKNAMLEKLSRMTAIECILS